MDSFSLTNVPEIPCYIGFGAAGAMALSGVGCCIASVKKANRINQQFIQEIEIAQFLANDQQLPEFKKHWAYFYLHNLLKNVNKDLKTNNSKEALEAFNFYNNDPMIPALKALIELETQSQSSQSPPNPTIVDFLKNSQLQNNLLLPFKVNGYPDDILRMRKKAGVGLYREETGKDKKYYVPSLQTEMSDEDFKNLPKEIQLAFTTEYQKIIKQKIDLWHKNAKSAPPFSIEMGPSNKAPDSTINKNR